MTVVAVAVLLGALLLFLIRVKQLKIAAAFAAVVFGLVLGSTPAGPQVNHVLNEAGLSGWTWVSSL
jgi:Na+-translocating ferredoxin:NAD+ oxidoreductase RnfD subunit